MAATVFWLTRHELRVRLRHADQPTTRSDGQDMNDHSRTLSQWKDLQEALNTFLKKGRTAQRLDLSHWPPPLRLCAERALQQGLSGEPEGYLLELHLQQLLASYLPKANSECYSERERLDLWLPALVIWAEYLSPPAIEATLKRGRPDWRGALTRLRSREFLKASPLEQVQDEDLLQAIIKRAEELEIGKITNRRGFYRLRDKGVEVLAQAVLAAAAGQLASEEGPRNLPQAGVPTEQFPLSAAPASAVPSLPHNYVVRRELASLGACLTAAGASGRAIVLTGIAGVGKSTLAAALASDPGVQAAFPDGILWLEVERDSPSELVRRLCHQVGITGWPHAPWLRYWRQWAAHPTRRALVILDDLVDPEALRAIVGPLGPQMALLVTTQYGTPVAEELANWLPAGTIQCLKVAGLAQEDAGQLFERILGHPLPEAELPWLSEVGERLGWHAGGLVFAAHQVQEYGWEGVLAELRAGRLADERLRRSSLVVG